MHKKLTDKLVAALKAPTDKPQINIFDSSYPALCLRVGQHGKAWTLHYRQNGKQHRITLGHYPDMGLADARDAWHQRRKQISEGHVLVAVNAPVAVAALTVADALSQWFAAWERGKRDNSVKSVKGHCRVIAGAWGDRAVSSIMKHDCLSLIDSLASQNKITSARLLYASLASFFKWLLKRDVITVNPMGGNERKDIGKSVARDRVLSDDELATLLRHVRGVNKYDAHLSAVHLLMLTGCRGEEIAGLRWSEINGDNSISFPAERMKNGDPFLLPLTSHIKDVLGRIPRIAGCPLVFGPTPLRFDRAKKRIDEATELTGWQFRDLRRTMQTGLQSLGFSHEVIDACVAHKLTGVRRVYLKHNYYDEKRQALHAWGEQLSRFSHVSAQV